MPPRALRRHRAFFDRRIFGEPAKGLIMDASGRCVHCRPTPGSVFSGRAAAAADVLQKEDRYYSR